MNRNKWRADTKPVAPKARRQLETIWDRLRDLLVPFGWQIGKMRADEQWVYFDFRLPIYVNGEQTELGCRRAESLLILDRIKMPPEETAHRLARHVLREALACVHKELQGPQPGAVATAR